MSLIVRWLSGHPGEWQRALTALADGNLSVKPSWILSDFVPKAGEGETISVYEIESEDDVEHLAGALAMSAPTFGRYVFVSVEADALDQVGLKCVASRGETNNNVVDGWHRDLVLPSQDAVNIAVNVFVTGDLLAVEKPIVQKTLEEQIRSDLFDWKKIAGVKPFQQRLASYVGVSLRLTGIPK